VKLRDLYEKAVRLETQGMLEPEPHATETDMLVAIEYALEHLADARDRERNARLEAESFRDRWQRRSA
jgi:hypothetical protein